MKKLLLISLLLSFYNKIFPCTVIFYADKNICLAGNNEDHFIPYTQILFLPSEKGKFGRVFLGYYADNCPDYGDKQGGMNEKGLFFDGLSLPPNPVQKISNKPAYVGNLMEKVLEECATVSEALNLIDGYNLSLNTSQIFIADRTGDAAIIEGDTIIRKNRNWLAATNFRLSEIKNQQFPCERYIKVKRAFDSIPNINVANIRDILNSVHNEGGGPTIYSNICDLKSNTIYLYHFHDFDNGIILSLADELKKGKHTVKLASLFSENSAYQKFEQNQRKAFDDLKMSRQKLYDSFHKELLSTSGEIDSDINVEGILNKYYKATGSKKGKDYIKTVTSRGTITSSLVIGSHVGNYTGTLLSFQNNQGKYYERVDLTGLIFIEKATDGKNSWKRNSYQPYKLLNGLEDEGFRLGALIESNCRELYKKITFLGTKEVEGTLCYKVLFETNNGYEIAKYFDKISGLQRAQLTVLNDTNDGPTKTWTIFDDYHNGTLLPNTVKLSITSQTPYAIQTSKLIITIDYLLNAPVDESLFNLPVELSNFK
jgi:hypothetical protein